MKYGFIRVAAASPNSRVADVEYNAENIIAEIKAQEKNNTEILVFPELCLCGYTCGDLFLQPVLIKKCKEELIKLVQASKGSNILVFVGLPIELNSKLYNCAAAFCNGKLLGIIPKTFLPNYGEFYEQRHFTPAMEENFYSAEWDTMIGKKQIFINQNNPLCKVGCEICEDLWVPNSPSISLAQQGATIIVNLSASDETIGKAEYRRMLLKSQSAKCLCGYIYADAGKGESTTDMVFAGHNLIAENGEILAQNTLFSGKSAVSEIDVEKLIFERRKLNTFQVPKEEYNLVEFNGCSQEIENKLYRAFNRNPFVPVGAELDERTELILSMQANALAKRFLHTHSKTAVIGISGGLDSTLALLVTAKAFTILNKDKKDIIAITMPGFGTTGNTLNNSLKLIKCIGATEKKIDIKKSVLQHFKDIGQDSEKLDVTYENSQARMRTLILMNTANKNNGLVIGTGDLSELALGWCTYNGDHMSMYAVNSSVPKTLVKHLVRHVANIEGGNIKKILDSILDTEISPELLPPDKDGNISQKTEDLVGPYELHDFYLYYAIRWGFEPKKILFLAENSFFNKYDKETLKKWLKKFYQRFFSQQFKRSCIPDGVKIGSVSLSPRADWRMPSDAVVKIWLDELEKI